MSLYRRVVIVARTRMYHDHVCIGGHDLDDGFRGLRLNDRHGHHWTSDAPFMVGEIWNMRYRKEGSTPPHVEDVAVREQHRVGEVADLRALILEHEKPWSGGPGALFDGTLRCTRGGSGYVPSKGTLPRRSTGFWLPDHDLVRDVTEGKRPRFKSERQGVVRWLTWVGVAEPPERIEAGSLVRVSLSRLWGSENAPDGYYLQISGVV